MSRPPKNAGSGSVRIGNPSSFLELVLVLDVGNADDSVPWMTYAALNALLEALEWMVTKLFIGSVAGLASTDRERHGGLLKRGIDE
jgi:hypothetical protein